MQVISDVVEVGVPILAGGPCRFRLGLGYSARGLGWTCQTTPSSREGSVSQTREREAVSTRGFGRFVPARFFSPHLRRLRVGRWLRHCSGGVGLRSERSGITGAMGPSMSWDP